MTAFAILCVLLTLGMMMVRPEETAGFLFYSLFWGWVAFAIFKFILRPIYRRVVPEDRSPQPTSDPYPQEGYAEVLELDPSGRLRPVGRTAYKAVSKQQ
jgi:hypothetical protein